MEFDIQDEKFNETIVAIEPNIISRDGISDNHLGRLMSDDPATAIDAIISLERAACSVGVLELYARKESDFVRIMPHEAILIAKHFKIIKI